MSVVGTNLKVVVRGVRSFFVVTLHVFGSTSTVVVLASGFVMVSTVWSVSCLLLFYSRYPPPYPAVSKSRGTCSPCPPYGVGASAWQYIIYSRVANPSWRTDSKVGRPQFTSYQIDVLLTYTCYGGLRLLAGVQRRNDLGSGTSNDEELTTTKS